MSQNPRKFYFFSAIAFCSLAAVFFFWKNKDTSSGEHQFGKVEFFSSLRGPAKAQEKKNRESTVIYKIKANATAGQKEVLDKVLALYEIKNHKKFFEGKVNYSKSMKQTSIGTENEIVNAISQTGAVEYAETDRLISIAYTPNDTFFSSQWHHTQINSSAAWDITQGVAAVTVVNCDSGVDSTHTDLRANLILPGYNAEDGTTNTEPINSHGTMTTGVIAAVTNNMGGVAGVAPLVKVLPVRISNLPDGSAFVTAIAACIEYAANNGAKVVNLSYTGAESFTIDTAAQYLRTKGGLLIMAAGNAGLDNSANPDFASFIIVGATDRNDARPFFSNFGTPTDIVAPGIDILTTDVNSGYVYASGTSMSAPIVSGVAALIYSLNLGFTPDAVEKYLFDSATRLGSGVNDPNFGNGIVNSRAAVVMANANVPPPTPTPPPVKEKKPKKTK